MTVLFESYRDIILAYHFERGQAAEHGPQEVEEHVIVCRVYNCSEEQHDAVAEQRVTLEDK